MTEKKKRGRPAKVVKELAFKNDPAWTEKDIHAFDKFVKKNKGPTPPQFHLSLQLGKELYESSGATMLEALINLPKPQKIFIKCILTATHGDRKKTFSMSLVHTKRLFFPIGRVYNAKRLAYGL